MERNSPFFDSQLLSEIHTLFPALLYDHARFRNLQDVFSYVRERLRARYDIFSNASREFQNSDQAALHRRVAVPVVSMNFVDSIGQVAISDLIRSFLYGTGANVGNSGGTGANSNPTNAQIESASQRFQFAGSENGECAVCQDSIVHNEFVRRITACQHTFHDGCLITWFQRHSTCPLCRNDIQTAGPTTTVIPPPVP